jgi:hypothetical protein
MNKLAHFLIYNNTIPLILGVLFLGAGATFASSPEARSTVVNAQTKVASIDNSYLLNTNITDEVVSITISSVTENEEMYFIEYQLATIGVQDGAWKPVVENKTFKVRKDTIFGQDLGLYADGELAEQHASEVRRLKEAQTNERLAGLTPKTVATEYEGLVGQFLDSDLKVFPQYDPLIDPAVGIPLTREQEKAHEAVRRLIEEAKEKEQQAQKQDARQEEQTDNFEEENNSGGEELPVEENPPVEEQPPTEDPIPTPPPPEPTPEPDPTPAPSVDTLFPSSGGEV